MLGKAREAVGPPWALVSRKKVPGDLGGRDDGYKKSERD